MHPNEAAQLKRERESLTHLRCRRDADKVADKGAGEVRVRCERGADGLEAAPRTSAGAKSVSVAISTAAYAPAPPSGWAAGRLDFLESFDAPYCTIHSAYLPKEATWVRAVRRWYWAKRECGVLEARGAKQGCARSGE